MLIVLCSLLYFIIINVNYLCYKNLFKPVTYEVEMYYYTCVG